jgi:hypothetical protein
MKVLSRFLEFMRLLGAGVFIFFGLLSVVVVLARYNLLRNGSPWMLSAAVMATLLLSLALLFVAAVWIFSARANFAGLPSAAEHLRQLEESGLVESTEFRAVRSFGVEEFEDEGLHYYLELMDGRVLFLSGQYLYEYEPSDDGPESSQPRRFPCSEFTVRRHKIEGYVVTVECRGTALQPELIAPPFNPRDWQEGRLPEDGDILAEAYDNLKRQRMANA